MRPFKSWTVKGQWWPTMRRSSSPALGTVLHHSVTKATSDALADVRAVEYIIWTRRFSSRFSMIAYSYIVHPNGTIFVGRGTRWRNGANKNDKGGAYNNSNTLSICLIGDYRTDNVTDAQRSAYYRIRGDLVRSGHLVPDSKELAHGDLAYTACPANAFDQITTFPTPDQDEEEEIMVTLIDSSTGEGWVASGVKARKLQNVTAWIASWEGPIRKSANMRHVISDRYEVV